MIPIPLFFHIGSPLNKLLREDEAQNLCNQALDFYETEDYESAIDILNRLADKYGKRGY